jgi:hypothetical protein
VYDFEPARQNDARVWRCSRLRRVRGVVGQRPFEPAHARVRAPGDYGPLPIVVLHAAKKLDVRAEKEVTSRVRQARVHTCGGGRLARKLRSAGRDFTSCAAWCGVVRTKSQKMTMGSSIRLRYECRLGTPNGGASGRLGAALVLVLLVQLASGPRAACARL